MTSRQLPGPVNALTHGVFEKVWWKGNSAEIEPLRADLGLPPARRALSRRRTSPDDLEIQAFDAALVPGLDWPARRPLVGFLTLDEELRACLDETGVDPALEAWLESGDPPVLLGFGSMPVHDPGAVVRMITEVGRSLGVRALVSAGWARLAGLEPDAPDVRVVGALDHDAVLPRCAAAVHHGGAGTTAASLGAGIPTVVCSVFADQPFWGAQVERLGLGAHVRFAALDAGTLEQGLRTALLPEVARRAREVGGALCAEPDPTAAVADLLEAEEGRTPRW